ncbi:MAG: DNA modification methylase [Deltaproteobacteria bacterium]|jgi:DNA modification methylase|nr:DNA modification methylase [Deltaproteobacteria bacterium]
MDKIALEYRPLDSLRPCGKALRRNDACVARMMEAIREYGFRVPILALRDGEIVDGELRWKAAGRLGLTEVPVLPADDLSPEQVRAFRLLVNRSATWATWDEQKLAQEIAALLDAEYDITLTGFDGRELDKLLKAAMPLESDPDAVPETPLTPVSRAGDVWMLDRHRLLCGDATKAADYELLLEGRRAAMIWTDPPYNVAYEGKAGGIQNDDMSDERFAVFLREVFTRLADILVPGCPIYVAHADAGTCGIAFRRAFLEAGFKLAACLIWRKNQAVLSRADYHWQHEPILYGWLSGAPHRWYGDRKQTTVRDAFASVTAIQGADGRTEWRVLDGERLLRISGENVLVEELPSSVIYAAKPRSSGEHPTMKPVELIERMLVNSSRREDIVLDAFGGSGSTLLACERTGRVCRIMELDPRFVDVIILRWQEATGKKALRAGSGKTFAELEAERLACEVRHE